MGEANSKRWSFVQRTSFDTPATRNMKVLRTTARETFRNRVGYQQSQTARTDANVQDHVRLSRSSGGGIALELEFPVANEALWLLLRAALRASEDAERSEASCTTNSGAKTLNKAGVDFTTGNTVEPGDIIRLSGSTGGADDGFLKVTAVAPGAGGLITVERAANFTGSATNVTVVRGARMKNGTQRLWFDAELGRLDVSLFELFERVVVNGFDLTIADGQITTAAFELLGVSSQRDSSTLCVDHTNPTVSPVLDALGVPVFNVGGLPYSGKSIGLSVRNNIQLRTQVTDSIANAIIGASWGTFEARTSIRSYLSNFTEIEKYVGNQDSDMWFVVRNPSGQALSFAIPAFKWVSIGSDGAGLNQDDYLDGEGFGKAHPTQGISLRMQRWVS